MILSDLGDQEPGELERFEATAGPELADLRLDAGLARLFPAFSRSRVKTLILAGAAAINGQAVTDPAIKVKAGDRLMLIAPPPVAAVPEPQDIPLDILFEDDELIVLNKPAGLVVHPTRGWERDTLVNALLFHCRGQLPGINGVSRPGIVHRLDKDTSGVMLAAKTERAMRGLQAQFADHGRTGPLRRAYVAFVWGAPRQARGTVDMPVGRDPRSRLKQAVTPDGRAAVTHFQVTTRFAGEGWQVTRLRCELETGRTHQIRVHMTHVGYPLLADPLYASGYATKSSRLPPPLAELVDGLGRQALHAAELGFAHPVSGEEMHFAAPLPPDLWALNASLAPYAQMPGAAPT